MLRKQDMNKPAARNVDWGPPTTTSGRVMQVFFNVNMAKQHGGLREIMAENGIDPDEIAPTQYVVFVNHRRDKVKLYAAKGVLAYVRLDGRELTMEALTEIPKAFRGSPNINANQTLLTAIETGLESASGKGGSLSAARKLGSRERGAPSRPSYAMAARGR